MLITIQIGECEDVKLGKDGPVRTIHLVYKNPNEMVFREVDRPIHGVAVIVPIEEQREATTLHPNAKEFIPATSGRN